MHLKQVCIFPQRFPIHDRYPFNLHIFSHPRTVDVHCPVTFFVGENGTGKSTLLQAISHRCGIYIWRGERRARFQYNPYETEFYKAVEVEWAQNTVPGSFFASESQQVSARFIDPNGQFSITSVHDWGTIC